MAEELAATPATATTFAAAPAAAAADYGIISDFVDRKITEIRNDPKLDRFGDPHIFEYVGKFAKDLFKTLPRGNRIDCMQSMDYTEAILTRYDGHLGMRGKMIMMMLQSDQRFDDIFVPKINSMIISWCNNI